MADSILRLKVESQEYDNKLKQATNGLTRYVDQCRKVGGTLEVVEKETLDYVKSVGQMEAVSKTATGKLSEMSKTFVELSAQYKNLTDLERQSPFGKALGESLDQLKVRINISKAQLDEIKRSISDTPGGNIGGGIFDGLGSKMEGALAVFGGNMLTKGVSMLTSELAGSVQQSIELARQGEGIRIAFERLNQPGLLDNLKAATHGTVSEVELMKQAIKFENFKLPVEDLANYLAFAQQKAKDTGESIDYLVNSIVNGLGRQSKQILDNLGISAAELTQRMNEGATMTEAVSAIIKEEMAKAGDYVETAADRAARATADTQNKMEELGRSAMPVAEEFASAWAEIRNGAMTLVLPVLSSVADSIRDIREILGGEWDMPKLKPGIPNLAEGPAESNQPKRPTWGDVPVVKAPGGYVEVTDSHTGEVIGGRHFDNLEDKNAIKDWQKGLNKPTPTSGPRNSTTPNLTPSQQAEADVQKALKEYSDAIANAQEKVMANMITGDDYNKQVQQGQQRLADAYLKAYNVTGNDQYLEGFKESAERYNEMSDVIKENIDTQIQQQQAARELEQAQKKLAEAQQKLADAKASGSATAVYKAQAAVDRLKNPNAQAQPTGFAALRQSIQGELKFDQMKVDETTLRTLLSTAIKDGIDEVTVDYNLLQDKISKGIDIPDSTWKELQDEINAKRAEMNIEPIKIDFNTGGFSTEGKKAEKSWQSAAVAVSAVGSAIQNIEDPAAKVVGTVAQAIATVALSFAQAMAKTSGPWEWVAFAATGLATMISTISAIHSATGYANGGIVGGNSFSGDNVYGGPDAMVNSGELILNKAQQNVVAQELQGGSRMIQVHGVLRGKDIFIAAENWSKSVGKGELVTW